MVVKSCITYNRATYSAVLRCEHCGHEQVQKDCQDTVSYAVNVLPAIICDSCRKTSDGEVAPMWTKQAEMLARVK